MLTLEKLESLYAEYNKRCFISPDPLQFLYNYENTSDREIAGVIAASLAYGRVTQILKSVEKILDSIAPSPAAFINSNSVNDILTFFKEDRILSNFKHRFTTSEDMALFLAGIKETVSAHGSLGSAFAAASSPDDKTVIPALEKFAELLCRHYPDKSTYLFPRPSKGSACKRPMLYLRWMIRNDDVDPGGWENIPASRLIIPLDTHMHNIAQKFDLTSRKSADLKTAVEITERFAEFAPDDPVKYDFVLTRFGIRDEMSINDLN